MVIRLEQQEINSALEIARQRSESKEPKYGSNSFNNNSSLANHQLGIIGELATIKSINQALHLDLKLDDTIYEYHGDSGYDVQIEKLNIKFDVKTTTYHSPNLLIPVYHIKPHVMYVLCKANLPDVEICGYATNAEVRKARQAKLKPSGPVNYIVERKNLTDWKELLEKLKPYLM